ncbi:MAG TPA: hypothetical protein VF210_11175 [Pseudomonadales bacterium]
MDRITAGQAEALSASGGAIVGNDSDASITSSGEVSLADSVQSAARALNLVNAAESTVANGVNVFDGRSTGAVELGAGAQFNVEQSNQIVQEQRRVASAPYYERTDANIDRTQNETGSYASTSTLSRVDQITDVESVQRSKSNESSGSVDALSTLLGQQVQAGRGLSAAGELGVDFVAGSFDFTAGGGVTVGDVSFDGEVSIHMELPELTVDIQGAGCAVQNGSCTATGNFTETVDRLSDHSTLFTVERSESIEESSTLDLVETIRAPFILEDAQAEYIVVDDSELTIDNHYLVALAGNAQADLRAMNVVNAAGSAVANGVNVARQDSAGLNVAGSVPVLNLVQANVISHSR